MWTREDIVDDKHISDTCYQYECLGDGQHNEVSTLHSLSHYAQSRNAVTAAVQRNLVAVSYSYGCSLQHYFHAFVSRLYKHEGQRITIHKTVELNSSCGYERPLPDRQLKEEAIRCDDAERTNMI